MRCVYCSVVFPVGYKQKRCELCEGFGYTKTKAKPVTTITGYNLE